MATLTFADLIGHLREQTKIDTLQADQFGAVDLIADSRFNVRIQEFPETRELLFTTALGAIQADQPAEEMYRTLLQANYRWVLTAGGSLALELGPEPEVVLNLREPLEDIDFERFEARLQDFIDCAGYWRNYLTVTSTGVAEAPQPTGDATDFIRV